MSIAGITPKSLEEIEVSARLLIPPSLTVSPELMEQLLQRAKKLPVGSSLLEVLQTGSPLQNESEILGILNRKPEELNLALLALAMAGGAAAASVEPRIEMLKRITSHTARQGPEGQEGMDVIIDTRRDNGGLLAISCAVFTANTFNEGLTNTIAQILGAKPLDGTDIAYPIDIASLLLRTTEPFIGGFAA